MGGPDRRAIDFSVPRPCPACGARVLPDGRNERFAYDDRGVYCREHAPGVDTTYAHQWADYSRSRKEAAARAASALDELNAPESR